MDDLEDVYQALISKVTDGTEHHKSAIDYYFKQGIELSKRYISLPLIGNGAGIAVCANAIMKFNTNQEFIALILPTTWLFFLGVSAGAMSVIFTNKGMYTAQNSIIADLNAKSLLSEVKSKLKLYEEENPKLVFENLLDYELMLLKSIITDSKLSKEEGQKSKVSMKVSQWASYISLILFPFAILMTLLPISIKYNFCWI